MGSHLNFLENFVMRIHLLIEASIGGNNTVPEWVSLIVAIGLLLSPVWLALFVAWISSDDSDEEDESSDGSDE